MRTRTASTALAVVLVGFASAPAGAAINAFACLPEWDALLRVIGGDQVTVTLATSPLEDPESLRATPAMITGLQGADLLVCTGADLEQDWLPDLLDRAANPKVAPDQPGYFIASTAVTLIADAVAEHSGEAEGEGHQHSEGNPHIQGDPRNVMKVAGQLARRMSEIDPDNAQLYSDNARAFIRELSALDKELEAEAAPLKGVNVAVQHENNLYLLQWLGIRTVATVEMQEGVPAGPSHLAAIIDQVPRDNIKFIVVSPFDDPASSQFIAEKSGIPVVEVPFTVGGTPESGDLIAFYRDSVARLLQGLNGVGSP